MLKVVIVEDREQNMRLLSAMVNAHNDLQLVGTATNVKDATNTILTSSPSLVLMDIELPDGTGFDVLESIKEHSFKVIFVTTHDSFAIKAFQYNAIDYILKPIDTELFYGAIQKAINSFKKENQDIQLQTLLSNINFPHQKTEKIILNTSSDMFVVEINNIVRCEADDSYTNFYINNRKMIMTAKSLKNYGEMLSNHSFVRTHKSHLVNLNHLDSFDKKNNMVLLSDGSKVPVSVRRKESFTSQMKAFYASK